MLLSACHRFSDQCLLEYVMHVYVDYGSTQNQSLQYLYPIISPILELYSPSLRLRGHYLLQYLYLKQLT